MGEKPAYFIIAFALSAIIGLYAFGTHPNITGTAVFDDDSEMGESSGSASKLLFVEPSKVITEQNSFVEKLKKTGKNKRPLYEEYIDVIGANGVLDGIKQLWPKCHSEAHDLGKVIFAKVKDIGKSLNVCADNCYSGCMHGILMEAFSEAQNKDDEDGHVDINTLKPLMNDLCSKNREMTSSYSPGDCAHGVGHALMFLSGYDIPAAIDGCKKFDQSAMKYYCATGAYMEYVNENDPEDAKNKSLFYPCDTYAYPAACSRYKMVHVVRRHYSTGKKTEELIKECENLTGSFRLGCFHGLGNGHMTQLASGRMSIKDLCLSGSEDEKFVCIEGAIERLSKYHENIALNICEQLEGKNKETCLNAAKQKMYNMDKNLTLYLNAEAGITRGS